MPAGLIENENGMGSGRDILRDFQKMEVHGEGVALGQDECRALAFLGTNGAEDIGRRGSLVVRGAGPRSASGPSPRYFVLLADAGLILEPYF